MERGGAGCSILMSATFSPLFSAAAAAAFLCEGYGPDNDRLPASVRTFA